MPYSYKYNTKLINDGKITICTPHKVVYFKKKTSTIKPELVARYKPVTRIQPKLIYPPPFPFPFPLDPRVTYRPPPIPTPQQILSPLTPSQSKSHKTKSLMQPHNKALRNPAVDTLLQYVSDSYPLDCRQDWTIAQMKAAMKNDHIKVHNHQKAAINYTQKH